MCLLALAFCIIIIVPVLFALAPSFMSENGSLSLEAYRNVVNEGRQWLLLRNSFLIALGSTFSATLLGLITGYSVECIRIPGRRFFMYCLATPFLIPPYISAIAWIDMLGNNGIFSQYMPSITSLYSIPGVIWVTSLAYFPLVTFSTIVALRRFDRRYEEAALINASPVRTFTFITLPILAPFVLCGSVFVFILAFVGFSVPSLLQVDVYTVEIYSRFSAFHDFRGAAAQVLPVIITGVFVLVAWTFWFRPRQAWSGGAKSIRNDKPQSRLLRTVATLVCLLIVIVSAVLPLSILVWRSLPLSSYVEIWQTASGEIGASVMLASISTVLLVVMSVLIAYLSRPIRKGQWIGGLAVLSFLVSGPVLGIGLISFWNHAGIRGYVYDSLLIVLLACMARFFFLAYLAVSTALKDMQPALEEAAQVAGIRWFQRLYGVVLPTLRPTLVAASGMCFIFTFRELDATVLVCPPGWTTMPVRLFTLMHYGPSSLVSALCVISVIIVLLAAIITVFIYSMFEKVSNERH